jgi:hypothetical protein
MLFSWERQKEREHLDDLNIDGRLIFLREIVCDAVDWADSD